MSHILSGSGSTGSVSNSVVDADATTVQLHKLPVIVIVIALIGDLFLALCFFGISTLIGRHAWGLGGEGVAGVRSEESLKLGLGLDFVVFRP